jgi:hypothetical protein
VVEVNFEDVGVKEPATAQLTAMLLIVTIYFSRLNLSLTISPTTTHDACCLKDHHRRHSIMNTIEGFLN